MKDQIPTKEELEQLREVLRNLQLFKVQMNAQGIHRDIYEESYRLLNEFYEKHYLKLF